MKTLYLLISALLINVLSLAQTSEETFSKAQKMFNSDSFDSTIELCKRIEYFAPDFKTDSVKSIIALSYYSLKQFDKALYYFSSFDEKFKIEKTICYILTNKYDLAQAGIINLNTDSNNTKSVSFLNICIALQTNQLDSLDKYINRSLSTNDSLQSQIKSQIVNYKKLQKQSLIIPTISSYIIPGMGLMLTGHFTQGINSLLLTSAFATAFIGTGFAYTFWDAGFAISPWFIRYYIGQIKKVRKMHEQKIAVLRYNLFQNILLTFPSKS